jgi:hypothetical protein
LKSARNESGLITDFSQIENSGLKKRVVTLLKDKGFSATTPSSMWKSSVLRWAAISSGKPPGSHLGSAGHVDLHRLPLQVHLRFAAVITLFHDVLIVLTYLLLFRIELSLQVIAAILTSSVTPSTTPSSSSTGCATTCSS